MTKDEALRKALEALEEPKEHIAKHRRLEAITAIKEVFAQPEQEPVACVINGKLLSYKNTPLTDECFLYEGPQPQRKPLTFEQVEDCFPDGYSTEYNGILVSAQWLHYYARAIEAAHGIKE